MKMRYENDLFYYIDEEWKEQSIKFINDIIGIESIGLLDNECIVMTTNGKYEVVWLKDRKRTRVNTLEGPDNKWDFVPPHKA